MQNLDWNLALIEVKDGILQPQPGPKKSGNYLCTCIKRTYDPKSDNEIETRYLRIMDYDTNKKCWHDVGSSMTIHNVLAWAEIDVCDFADFEYQLGYVIKK